jgi:hypothetical protein
MHQLVGPLRGLLFKLGEVQAQLLPVVEVLVEPDVLAFLHLSPLAVVDQGRVGTVVWRRRVGVAAVHASVEVHHSCLLLLEGVLLLPTPMTAVEQGANIQLSSIISLPILTVLPAITALLVALPVLIVRAFQFLLQVTMNLKKTARSEIN